MKSLVIIGICIMFLFNNIQQDTVKQEKTVQVSQTIKKDTIKKISDEEHKKQEWIEYQKKQQNLNKNLEETDKSILLLEKQSAKMDSILKKKK